MGQRSKVVTADIYSHALIDGRRRPGESCDVLVPVLSSALEKAA